MIRERLEQRNLGIRERPHLGPEDRDRAERLSLAEQRDLGHAVNGVELQQRQGVRVLGLRHRMNVVEHDTPALEYRTPSGEPPGERQRQPDEPLHLRAGVRGVVQPVAFQPLDHGIARRTEAHRARRDGVQHGLKLGGRLRDDPEDVRGRRLPIERRPEVAVARLELLEQADVFDRDHRLVGEGFQELDLTLGKRPRRAA